MNWTMRHQQLLFLCCKQCYFKTPFHTGISEFKHSYYNQRRVSIKLHFFLIILLDWYHHIHWILGKWKNENTNKDACYILLVETGITWEEYVGNICTYLAEAVYVLQCVQ